MKRLPALVLAAALAAAPLACGQQSEPPAAKPAPPAEAPPPPAEHSPPPAAKPVAEPAVVKPVNGFLRIEGNDQLQYSVERFEVTSGEKLRIEFAHVGTLDKAVAGHNLVVLNAGVNLQAFAIAALTASENDYIPPKRAGDVLAHTPLLGGGQTATIEFTAPAAGTYHFLCTFPGHYATMQGEMIVR